MSRITVDIVLKKLSKEYPHADCTLDFSSPFELLIASILSAQCTDKRVNIITKYLFKKYRTPKDYLSVPTEVLENDIRSCGSYHMKTRAIQETCAMLIEKFHGKVPQSMDEVTQLRGVGRKIGSIVLGCGFGIIEGIPVDTHVLRVSQRLGITKEKTQAKIERDLMKKTPCKEWLHLSHLLVAHGRAVCKAPTPLCANCVFAKICPSSTVHRQ